MYIYIYIKKNLNTYLYFTICKIIPKFRKNKKSFTFYIFFNIFFLINYTINETSRQIQKILYPTTYLWNPPLHPVNCNYSHLLLKKFHRPKTA